jgi:hypothetical protein
MTLVKKWHSPWGVAWNLTRPSRSSILLLQEDMEAIAGFVEIEPPVENFVLVITGITWLVTKELQAEAGGWLVTLRSEHGSTVYEFPWHAVGWEQHFADLALEDLKGEEK